MRQEMCVSLAKAKFSGTALMMNTTQHPGTGAKINVLGYQNKPVNLAGSSANAMLLHFPTWHLSKENIVDTSRFPHFLDDAVEAATPRTRSVGAAKGIQSDSFEIFDHDIYTVVVTSDITKIPEALEAVREDRRPTLNKAMFDWYAENFVAWSFALCCFNNSDARKANPLLWWYEPLMSDVRMLPGIDAHDGGPPNLESRVDVDHWVIVGTGDDTQRGATVRYRDQLDPFAQALLPKRVSGAHFGGHHKNGDFLVHPNGTIERGITH